MKKLVLITALFSLSSLAADQNGSSWWGSSQSKTTEQAEKPVEAKPVQAENPVQGEEPLKVAMKFVRDVQDNSVVQAIAAWFEVPFEQRVKDNPKTALVFAAATGALLRKTSLAVGAGVAVYHLVKKQQPEESAIKQVLEKQKPESVNSEASAQAPQGAGVAKEASTIAQLAAAGEQASQ
jgi:hypothetical protein